MDLIVADLHCGSRWGLTPPDYWTIDTPKNIKWLWQCWESMADALDGAVGRLILLGDLIDGPQPKSKGTGLLCGEMSGQVAVAISALSHIIDRIAKGKLEIRRYAGTLYHETHDGPLEKLDATLGINMPRRIEDQIAEWVHYRGTGAIVHYKHEPETGGTVHPNAALEREIAKYIELESMGECPIATHLVRAHRHMALRAHRYGKLAYAIPAWSFRNPWALHKGFARWRPDIGYALAVPDSSDPIDRGLRIVMHMFPLPTILPEEVDL